jgi:hypothetical protein
MILDHKAILRFIWKTTLKMSRLRSMNAIRHFTNRGMTNKLEVHAYNKIQSLGERTRFYSFIIMKSDVMSTYINS